MQIGKPIATSQSSRKELRRTMRRVTRNLRLVIVPLAALTILASSSVPASAQALTTATASAVAASTPLVDGMNFLPDGMNF
jgi:hypothetical protein